VTSVEGDGELVVERFIDAPPETVFSFFSDRDRWLRWQGVTATIDPRAGGVFRMNVRGDGFASGRFLEVRPPERVVFTWGWEASEGIPPGSTTVEVHLRPEGTGTRVVLRHRHLPTTESVEQHAWGWSHYLDRLMIVAAGGDPGPDPTVIAGGDR
jgi:uncharacterized protein YndB with AHSA1/START domain